MNLDFYFDIRSGRGDIIITLHLTGLIIVVIRRLLLGLIGDVVVALLSSKAFVERHRQRERGRERNGEIERQRNRERQR